MTGSMLQIVSFLLIATIVGAAIGWLLRQYYGQRQRDALTDQWQIKFDEAARQRDRFNSENTKLRASIEAQQAASHKHEIAATRCLTELESARERLNSVSKEMFAIKNERDALTHEVSNGRQIISNAQLQIAEFGAESEKIREFYKGELAKSFEKRKTFESKLADAESEQESLGNLLESAKSENEAVNKVLESAQTRLDNLDEIERKAIELEAENAELRHQASKTKQDIEVLRRDVAELDELKSQNRELSHCLKSMENSRKQYEQDAKRYREKAVSSEQVSDTLQVKLDSVEQSLTKLAKQQDKAQKKARDQEALQQSQRIKPTAPVIDDLTEIVGIGKVFQRTLHDLGVTSFQQLAGFGPSDIARVNVALKEYRGRMEQDDWIGQAKELHFKKYATKVG